MGINTFQLSATRHIWTGFLVCLLCWVPVLLSAQERHSWEGSSIRPDAHFRTLNIMVNIIYDVHPDTNPCPDTRYWPKAYHPGINNQSIPSYLLDFMDTEYRPGQLHGTMTRLYGEASFDALQITGDFIVVNIPESFILANGRFVQNNIAQSTIQFINEHGGLQTLYGHNSIKDYDFKGDRSIFFTQIHVRNITAAYGGANPGSGWANSYLSQKDKILIGDTLYPMSSMGTMQCVGNSDISSNASSIVTHEISHSFFGSNDFHTSGGNHRGGGCMMSFLNIQGGYGLMGAAESSLVGCNGYERWRMHWKHPESVSYIAARDTNNVESVVSDINITDGNCAFLLRDFVTYGDVVRIHLPYKDTTTSSEQYIWLENHQVGSNNKLDYYQFANTADCRPYGQAGIYAYYQVGRDQLTGTVQEVWDVHNRDNLRCIPAEGYYDYEMVADTQQIQCVAYGTRNYAFVRKDPNPFCGSQDQQRQFFPAAGSTTLKTSDEYAMWHKRIGGLLINNLPNMGDDMDAFTGYRKINMGTNPSTCNAITCHSNNNGSKIIAIGRKYDTRNTYLSGLSIEMVPQKDHNVLIRIRWDDYRITNDTRWTGSIILQDTAILTAGKLIKLAQNRTVIQPTLNEETGLFSHATSFTCKNHSLMVLESQSNVILTEGSQMIIDSNSRLELRDGAEIKVRSGCSLIIRKGAELYIGKHARISTTGSGTIIVEDESILRNYNIKQKQNVLRKIEEKPSK